MIGSITFEDLKVETSKERNAVLERIKSQSISKSHSEADNYSNIPGTTYVSDESMINFFIMLEKTCKTKIVADEKKGLIYENVFCVPKIRTLSLAFFGYKYGKKRDAELYVESCGMKKTVDTFYHGSISRALEDTEKRIKTTNKEFVSPWKSKFENTPAENDFLELLCGFQEKKPEKRIVKIDYTRQPKKEDSPKRLFRKYCKISGLGDISEIVEHTQDKNNLYGFILYLELIKKPETVYKEDFEKWGLEKFYLERIKNNPELAENGNDPLIVLLKRVNAFKISAKIRSWEDVDYSKTDGRNGAIRKRTCVKTKEEWENIICEELKRIFKEEEKVFVSRSKLKTKQPLLARRIGAHIEVPEGSDKTRYEYIMEKAGLGEELKRARREKGFSKDRGSRRKKTKEEWENIICEELKRIFKEEGKVFVNANRLKEKYPDTVTRIYTHIHPPKESGKTSYAYIMEKAGLGEELKRARREKGYSENMGSRRKKTKEEREEEICEELKRIFKEEGKVFVSRGKLGKEYPNLAYKIKKYVRPPEDETYDLYEWVIKKAGLGEELKRAREEQKSISDVKPYERRTKEEWENIICEELKRIFKEEGKVFVSVNKLKKEHFTLAKRIYAYVRCPEGSDKTSYAYIMDKAGLGEELKRARREKGYSENMGSRRKKVMEEEICEELKRIFKEEGKVFVSVNKLKKEHFTLAKRIYNHIAVPANLGKTSYAYIMEKAGLGEELKRAREEQKSISDVKPYERRTKEEWENIICEELKRIFKEEGKVFVNANKLNKKYPSIVNRIYTHIHPPKESGKTSYAYIMEKAGLGEELKKANNKGELPDKMRVRKRKVVEDAGEKNKILLEILGELRKIQKGDGLPVRNSEFLNNYPKIAYRIYKELDWLILPPHYNSLYAYIVSLIDAQDPIAKVRNFQSFDSDDKYEATVKILRNSDVVFVDGITHETLIETIKEYERNKK
ncbi:hypothetical protein KO465_06725 [Candidatus Micrarchaeota archaeon]|nr:hypothetical protein [Candidatus Micrarchaeota archaeon]